MSFNGMDTYLKPRLCHLLKWPDFNGYGFNLHAEKGKAGQYIGKVDDGSPAEAAGMKDGDRIVEVNGVNIGNENHQQVVGRIKAGGDETRLLVVDSETDKHYKDEKKVVKGDLPEVVVIECPRHDTEPAQAEVPPSYNDVAEPETVTSTQVETSVTTNTTTSQFIPRLCHIKKRPDFNGYGFNLHAERDKPGQYIGKIDDDSPSLAADLREGDRIVEVNGTNIESEQHGRVIELIKSGGDETRLLVVDKAADEYYKSQGITVSSSMAEVRHTSSVPEESHVSAVVEHPPVFHVPPPPTDIPPPDEEEEEDFNVDELTDLAVHDEAVQEAVEATQVAEVEAEPTPPEDIPPPQDESVEIDQQVEQQISAEVSETIEAVAVDTEPSAVEEVTQNAEEVVQSSEEVVQSSEEIVQSSGEIVQSSEEFVQSSEEITATTAEVAETLPNVENELVQNDVDVEVTQAAEAEFEVANDVQAAVEEEIKETVSEVTENVPPPVEEPVAETTPEVVPEPVEEAAPSPVNGQTTVTETVTTYSPPEPEPEPEPTPAPAPVSQPEPTPAPSKQANGSADIFGGLSAAEMKERLKSRKKADPRTQHVGFSEKHKLFERL